MLTDKTKKRLQGIAQCSRNGHKVNRLFQLMTNYEDLWNEVSENIGSNRGAKTPGVDGLTHRDISGRLDTIRESLRSGQYRSQPARRVYIPKKSGKLRPLGIPTAADKMVQAMVARLLEEIYEPVFSDCSHGFRKGRSCHTALDAFKHNWNSMKWIIEADIRGCFDNINHNVLIQILAKRINDRRFLKLIKGFLQAGYLEDWNYRRTFSGTPQGGTVSPILANIYLHELDEWLQAKVDQYNRGTGRKKNPEYKKRHSSYQYALYRSRDLKEAGRLAEAEVLQPVIAERKAAYMACDPSDSQDPNFRRMRFIRYADDFIVGIIGPKADAQALMTELKAFMKNNLKVELAEEKTGIVNSSEGTRFLGYDLKVITDKHRMVKSRGGSRRSMLVGVATLEWPMQSVVKFAWERGYIDNIQDRKTRPRTNLLELSEEKIIRRYIQELRGVSNYYSRARNWKHVGNLLHWWCQDSLARTLGKKMRIKRPLVYARYKHNDSFGISDGSLRVELHPPAKWKRFKNDDPDRKPAGSIPSFQK